MAERSPRVAPRPSWAGTAGSGLVLLPRLDAFEAASSPFVPPRICPPARLLLSERSSSSRTRPPAPPSWNDKSRRVKLTNAEKSTRVDAYRSQNRFERGHAKWTARLVPRPATTDPDDLRKLK
jgi:hypothetical protein